MARPIVSGFIGIRDAPGSESIVRIHMPTNTEIATFQTFLGDTATLIDAVVKGKITSLSVGIGVDLPGGLKSTPDSAADVEEGARFIFGTANGGSTRVRLPTFDEAKMVSGTDLVNTSDTDVAAFVTQMIDGETITLQAQHPSGSDESDITSLTSARSAFQRERPA
jgi:hypothetical protein